MEPQKSYHTVLVVRMTGNAREVFATFRSWVLQQGNRRVCEVGR